MREHVHVAAAAVNLRYPSRWVVERPQPRPAVLLQAMAHRAVEIVPAVPLLPVPAVIDVDRMVVGNHLRGREIRQPLVVYPARAGDLRRDLRPRRLAIGRQVVGMETGSGRVADLGMDQRADEGRKLAVCLADRRAHVVAVLPNLGKQPTDVGPFRVVLSFAIHALEPLVGPQLGAGRQAGHNRKVVGQRLVEHLLGLGDLLRPRRFGRRPRKPDLRVIGTQAQGMRKAHSLQTR